jgi:hypothetical protein
MEVKYSKIEDDFYGPNKEKGELAIEPAPNHNRVVRSIAKCPWHEEITASIMADHCKATFHCFSCGAEGSLVTGANDGFLALQREDV